MHALVLYVTLDKGYKPGRHCNTNHFPHGDSDETTGEPNLSSLAAHSW